MRILAISGSLRRESHNTALLRAAADRLPPGVELELFTGLDELPHYNQDLDVPGAAPEAAERLRTAIASADAILVSTPEYNSSIPGVLKNAIDWVSRPYPDSSLRDKPAAVIGASTGTFGAVWAQAELRKVLSTAGARTLDHELPVAAANSAFDERGQLRDPELAERLWEIVAHLTAEAGAATPPEPERIAA